jgi:hypothetical protein
MKKIILSLSTILVFGISANSQVLDTLSEFFTGTATLYDASGGGYLSGNNSYDDLAKIQRFNDSTGVTGPGDITGALLFIPVKTGSAGTFKVSVWSFNSVSTIGTVLGSKTISISSVDTTSAGVKVCEGTKFYNLKVVFDTPIAIPASKDFLIGVELPTVAGDTIALATNTDGDFLLAETHTFEVWSDNTFIDYVSSWPIEIAHAIYPTVSFYTVGINEKAIEASVYPNPTADVLNIKVEGIISSVSIKSLDGKLISNQVANTSSVSIDVAGLTKGVYFYEVNVAGTLVRNTFVKK